MSHDLDPRRMEEAAWLLAPHGRGEREFEEKLNPGVRRPLLFTHCQVARSCRAAATAPDPPAKKLAPGDTNPGFVKADGSLDEDKALSKLIADFLKRDFPTLLGQVRIGLVDLKGIDKLCAPKVAGFALTTRTIGGSLTKILIYYAAYQLLFDLRELVRIHKITTFGDLNKRLQTVWKGMKCWPALTWLFKFEDKSTRERGLLAVDMNAGKDPGARKCKRIPPPPPPEDRPAHLQGYLFDIVRECDSTRKASELIMRIGFEYIASLAWQSGLWHPRRGGLWFSTTYCSDLLVAPVEKKCHTATKSFCGAESRVIWDDDPVGGGAIHATALAAVTYYTLLAQRRLVSPSASAGIEGHLKHACTYLRGGSLALPTRARKCGDVGNLLHDAGLIEYPASAGGHRYAVAILTVGKSGQLPHDTFRKIAKGLDTIVKTRSLP